VTVAVKTNFAEAMEGFRTPQFSPFNREYLWQHFETLALTPENPKGIPPQSPGLRGTSYPGIASSKDGSTPTGLWPEARAGRDATPLGVGRNDAFCLPKAGSSRQSRSLGHSLFGAGDHTAHVP